MTYLEKALSYIHISVEQSPYEHFKEDIEGLIKQYIVDKTCPLRWGIDKERDFSGCRSYPYLPFSGCHKHWEEEFTE